MPFTHIIFDLDETLYPRNAGLMQEIGKRIHLWVQQTLGLPPEEAATLRQTYLERYGTTLGGLLAEHDVDAEAYLQFVHDIPLEQYVRPNPALAAMLAAIPLRRVVYTNATSAHARRVLQILGVDGLFEHVVGIQEVGLRNKPRLDGNQRMLELIGAEGPSCILVDDRVVNLRPAKSLGMTTVLVDAALEEGVDFVVGDVLEVGPLVARILEGARDG